MISPEITCMNHSQRIAEIRAILTSGVTSTNVDGTTIQLDLDSLRRELHQLQREDDGQHVRKPRVTSVNLSRLR